MWGSFENVCRQQPVQGQQRRRVGSTGAGSSPWSCGERDAGPPRGSTARARRAGLHIKKPLNAFMVFMKEMRQTVIDESTLKESAAINQILGRRVSTYPPPLSAPLPTLSPLPPAAPSTFPVRSRRQAASQLLATFVLRFRCTFFGVKWWEEQYFQVFPFRFTFCLHRRGGSPTCGDVALL